MEPSAGQCSPDSRHSTAAADEVDAAWPIAGVAEPRSGVPFSDARSDARSAAAAAACSTACSSAAARPSAAPSCGVAATAASPDPPAPARATGGRHRQAPPEQAGCAAADRGKERRRARSRAARERRKRGPAGRPRPAWLRHGWASGHPDRRWRAWRGKRATQALPPRPPARPRRRTERSAVAGRRSAGRPSPPQQSGSSTEPLPSDAPRPGQEGTAPPALPPAIGPIGEAAARLVARDVQSPRARRRGCIGGVPRPPRPNCSRRPPERPDRRTLDCDRSPPHLHRAPYDARSCRGARAAAAARAHRHVRAARASPPQTGPAPRSEPRRAPARPPRSRAPRCSPPSCCLSVAGWPAFGVEPQTSCPLPQGHAGASEASTRRLSERAPPAGAA
eukprot:scaffold17717_cov112-Isochrysis_galbana.AAC.6